LKLAFVEALQRFTRAQAGTFGDEGRALLDALGSMTEAWTRWDAAMRRFQADAGRQPPSADLQLVVATVLLDAERAADALRELDAADRMDGARADVHAMRAMAYGLIDRPLDAIGALRTAAAMTPDDPTIFYALARTLAAVDRADEASDARRDFHRALVRSGGLENVAAPRAPFQRIALLRQAAGAAPIFPQGRYAAGFAALYEGRYADALASFAAATRSDPLVSPRAVPVPPDGGEVPSREQLARAAEAFRRGEIGAATQMLQATVAQLPAYAEAHRLLGLISWIDGQHARGIEHLRTAIRLAPEDERARVLLADVLLSEGRTSEAERELTQALGAGGASGSIHYRLAQLYLRLALLPQAIAALESAEQPGAVAGRDHIYQMLGSMRVDRADFEGAIAAYLRRIEVNPNSGEAHRQLAEIYFLRGRHDEALLEFAVAVWLDPGDARAHAGAAHVHMRAGRYAEAVADARNAVALDPQHRQARYALGTALMRSGDADAGARELTTFERLEAAAAAADRRAFQLDALRREASRAPAERAVALMEEALAMDPQDMGSRRDLGTALLRARRPHEAIPHLLAAQQAVETLDGFRYLAEAFTAAGDSASAAAHVARYTQAVGDAKAARIRELSGMR
jgi:tetratricopeptide (TPR) repeat protein